MSGITRGDAQAAAKRLVAGSEDYKLVYSYMAQEFDITMRRVLHVTANNELFVEVGMARAFNDALKILRGDGANG